MGLGHGKKRPLPGGETSESKRGFSRRAASVVDAIAVNTAVSGHVSAEQGPADPSPTTYGSDEMAVWRDDLHAGIDSEAYIISNILEGRYSTSDKPGARSPVSERTFCSHSTVDLSPQLCGLQAAGNRFVEFEQHRNWVRSVCSRKNESDALTKSANGFLILHHRAIEEPGVSHARSIRAQWSGSPNCGQLLDGREEQEQQRCHTPKSHYEEPFWNCKDVSLREGYKPHQNESGSQVKEKKPSHRPTFAIFLGKIVSDYTDSFSSDERSRLSTSVDRARAPLAQGVSNLLDGLQKTEPDKTKDLASGGLRNERQFMSYVNSSGRLNFKEGIESSNGKVWSVNYFAR